MRTDEEIRKSGHRSASYEFKTAIACGKEEIYAHITETQWAYLAGIIDGEGCIHIRKQFYTGRKKNTVNHCLTIAVGNTSAAMIKWLHGTFQGSCMAKRGRTSTRREVWAWLVASEKAEEICRRVIPYLTTKKDQAELALLFRETYWGYRMRSKQPVEQWRLDLREWCYDDMKAFKRTEQVFD